ncbi:monocarboxylate transporter 9-like [Uloborus diversus]|uniref:monocarboxylate transporter 9-like n=1 Tax=Uloborus diversus TaxID=327109 RepID=UPI0024091D1B|nr:monocarboxylate transporter 9-like [Uloborus diversus]
MVELEEPDKGRAWLIAFCACIINMILSGLSRMIGILYVGVIGTYGVSRQDATLPFTVRNGIRCLSGPIVGVIGQRYGIRAVTFAGGVVASAGAALCCIAPNIAWLAVFWGGVHGFGFAFANTLFQVVVNQYFRKYRATASGIALSGACVGSLGFPFMIEAILDTYGLAGGFLILGGVVMHVLPPSLLLKSPPWIEDPQGYARQVALRDLKQSNETLDTVIETKEAEDVKAPVPITKLMRSTSLDNCPTGDLEICNTTQRYALKKEVAAGVMSHLENLEAEHRKRGGMPDVICTLYKIAESPTTDAKNGWQNGSKNVKNQPSVYTISGNSENMTPSDDHSNSHPEEKGEYVVEEPSSLLDSLKTIVFLYSNPVYVLISLCMATYIIIFIPILTVIVDYSKDKGIPETYGKYLINAMAIGDLIGRLCFGWVTDKGYMTISAFMMLCLALQGAFIVLFPFALDLWSFMILLGLYGAAAGSILVLFPVLVMKYVDQKGQSVAMGCVGFLSGLVSFGIPPLIGHFRDNVGSYDGMFYLTGAISVASGGLWLLEPLMGKMYFKRMAKEEQRIQDEKEAEANGSSSAKELKIR